MLRNNDGSSIIVVVHGVHGGLLLKALCLLFAIAVADNCNENDDSDDGADDCAADGACIGSRVVILAGVVVGAVVVGVVAVRAPTRGAASSTRGTAIVPASI